MNEATAIAALYGAPAAQSAVTHGTLPAATAPAAPAAPAVKPAPYVSRRGIEPDDEPAALADPDADEAFDKKPKPHGNAAYAARAAERAADEQQHEQDDDDDDGGDGGDGDEQHQVEPKGNDKQQQQQDEQEYVPSDSARATYGSVMRSLVDADVNRLGADRAAAEANATAVAGIFEAFSVGPNDADHIIEVAVAAAKHGISDEQHAQNHSAAMDALRIDFGPANVDRAVQLAQKLVAKHPSVRGYLAESGLGNSPVVVRAVAAQAWRLAAEGKL